MWCVFVYMCVCMSVSEGTYVPGTLLEVKDNLLLPLWLDSLLLFATSFSSPAGPWANGDSPVLPPISPEEY